MPKAFPNAPLPFPGTASQTYTLDASYGTFENDGTTQGAVCICNPDNTEYWQDAFTNQGGVCDLIGRVQNDYIAGVENITNAEWLVNHSGMAEAQAQYYAYPQAQAAKDQFQSSIDRLTNAATVAMDGLVSAAGNGITLCDEIIDDGAGSPPGGGYGY